MTAHLSHSEPRANGDGGALQRERAISCVVHVWSLVHVWSVVHTWGPMRGGPGGEAVDVSNRYRSRSTWWPCGRGAVNLSNRSRSCGPRSLGEVMAEEVATVSRGITACLRTWPLRSWSDAGWLRDGVRSAWIRPASRPGGEAVNVSNRSRSCGPRVLVRLWQRRWRLCRRVSRRARARGACDHGRMAARWSVRYPGPFGFWAVG